MWRHKQVDILDHIRVPEVQLEEQAILAKLQGDDSTLHIEEDTKRTFEHLTVLQDNSKVQLVPQILAKYQDISDKQLYLSHSQALVKHSQALVKHGLLLETVVMKEVSDGVWEGRIYKYGDLLHGYTVDKDNLTINVDHKSPLVVHDTHQTEITLPIADSDQTVTFYQVGKLPLPIMNTMYQELTVQVNSAEKPKVETVVGYVERTKEFFKTVYIPFQFYHQKGMLNQTQEGMMGPVFYQSHDLYWDREKDYTPDFIKRMDSVEEEYEKRINWKVEDS